MVQIADSLGSSSRRKENLSNRRAPALRRLRQTRADRSACDGAGKAARLTDDVDGVGGVFGVLVRGRRLIFLQPRSIGESVSVIGDFNGWRGQGHRMLLDRRLGVWKLVVELSPQAARGVCRYQLLIDGRRACDGHNIFRHGDQQRESVSVVRMVG